MNWGDCKMIKIPFNSDDEIIKQWCCDHIGLPYENWSIASNAHSHIFFIPNKHAMWFILKWKK